MGLLGCFDFWVTRSLVRFVPGLYPMDRAISAVSATIGCFSNELIGQNSVVLLVSWYFVFKTNYHFGSLARELRGEKDCA
jgi:hypothetical protein